MSEQLLEPLIAMSRRVDDLLRQNRDLQACNNRLLERARSAETDRDNSNRLLDECRIERNFLQKLCADRADALSRAEAERDDWRETAKNCAGFVAIHAAQHAHDRSMDGLAPVHFDLMTKLGLRMVDFKRAEPEVQPHA